MYHIIYYFLRLIHLPQRSIISFIFPLLTWYALAASAMDSYLTPSISHALRISRSFASGAFPSFNLYQI